MFYPESVTLNMASLKVLLWGKKNKEGKYPIAIRIIKDRKPSYIYIGHYIDKNQWDENKQRVKKNHPNSARLNNLILAKHAEANDKLLELEKQKEDTTSQVIKRSIKSDQRTSFFAQADIYLRNIKESGKYNRLVAEEPRIRRFKAFLKDQDISFRGITVGLLKEFQAYLKGKQRLKERTIMNYMIVIRTIYNQAINAGLVDRKHYPFGRDKIVIKYPESLKVGLSAEEVQSIEALNLEEGAQQNHARNIWLISFYFAGMRASDVFRLQWSDFQNERLHYSMGKNAKSGSLKTPEKALRILAQYKDGKKRKGLIFPELKGVDLNNSYEVQRKISYGIKTVNKYLKQVAELAGIDKKLTMHIARHTFGNISGDKIPVQMLQKLYRHSSITTTIGYQANFIHKDADDALDSVIGS